MSEFDLASPEISRRPIPTPAAFARPTLIRPLYNKPLQWETLDGLARHLHVERSDRALRIGPVLAASYGGSDTFPCFEIYVVDTETQAETWLGAVAIQSDQAGKLQDALRRTEPKPAAA